MTRKVTLLGLAVAALLVPAGGASAAAPDDIRAAASGQTIRSAAFGPLTPTTARRLAVKLGRTAARERAVRWWTLSDAVSVRRNRVTFEYGDRKGDVFCVATIVVEQPSAKLRRTRFATGACGGVPSEALAVELATSRLIKASRAREPELRESIADFDAELAACEELRVPRSRLDDVRRLFLTQEAVASIAPLGREIGSFVTALRDLRLTRPDLAPGATHWDRFATAVAAAAQHAADARPLCESVRRWAAAGWTADAAPANLEGLRLALESIRAAERGIKRVALNLAKLGVSPRVVLGFTPAGLVQLTAPSRIVCGAPNVRCKR
ncbi:MAG TPA: hypothetical protein VF712_04985 [Thermoleophilaceae bacterium]|jgi:hypothetical protein